MYKIRLLKCMAFASFSLLFTRMVSQVPNLDNGNASHAFYIHESVDTAEVRDTVIPTMLGESLAYGMDTTMSPCEDFYQFVNGGWRDRAVVPAKQNRSYQMASFFDDAYRRMRKRMDVILDSARLVRASTNDHTLRVLGEFYESCMVADSLERSPFIRQRSSLLPIGGNNEQGQELIKKDSTRAEQCSQRTLQRIGGVAGQAFIQDLQNSGAVSRMDKMLVDIKHSVVKRIKDHPLLSEDEKLYALERLDRLILRVGIPEQLVDYSGLALSDSNYEHNKKEIAGFSNLQWVSSIGSDVREKWKASLLTPNAFYMPRDHAIEIPPVMFSPPFFYANGDDALNYAGVGFVIGHEIYHSLAQILPQIKNVEMKAQMDSFKAFNTSMGELDGWKANGNRTFNEDIADLGGIRASYAAWQSTVSQDKSSQSSTLNNLSPDQVFFINVGLIWRSKWTGVPPNNDVHAPHFARVNAVVMQMPEFAKAFSCSPTDPMVLAPDRLSKIW